MKRLRQGLLSSLLGTGILLGGVQAQACTGDGSQYIGSLCTTAANFCPASTHMEAAGQVLSIADNQALYSLIGTTYGGNGHSTFALPDLRGRTPVGWGRGPGLSDVPFGRRRGNETSTLTVANLASHNHEATFTPGGEGSELEVSIPVSSNNADNTPTPDANHSYLAGSSAAGPQSADIWSGEMNQATTIQGVTTSGGGGGGSVTVGHTGGGQSFSNLPPQLALTYCIAHTGLYPQRP